MNGFEASLQGVTDGIPKEGDLYKRMTVRGRTFEIRYGYYEEIDRQSMYNTPIEIYPDFVKAPVYTDDGIPFVTAMQKKCENYDGEPDDESTCFQCAHYEKCEELLGVCLCRERRKTS